jgi:hypothetical protein
MAAGANFTFQPSHKNLELLSEEDMVTGKNPPAGKAKTNPLF